MSPNIHWKSLPGPQDIHRSELSNGITLLCRRNGASPSVVISGYLIAGSQFDPPEKAGLAYLTSLMLMRGTQKHSFQQIFDALESAGASLGFGASVHNVSFSGRSLAEDLPLLLDLTAECLFTPTFPLDQLERLRAQMMTGFAMREQDTEEMASMRFEEILFPDHPYGRAEDGYTETVRPLTQAELISFHQTHYGPKGMVIVGVGSIEPQQGAAMVEERFGTWQNPHQTAAAPFPPIHSLTTSTREHIAITGKIQSDLVMGCLGPHRKSPDYLAASLGNNILGQFGMMGRIGDVVREQAGLAYSASTSLNAWIAAGSWEVSAGVNPVNLDKAIDLIIVELRRFTSEQVTAEELADSQANYIGRLPLSLESNGGVAGALLNLERFQLGLDYYQRYPTLIQAVTRAEVLEAARRWLDADRLAIVSAGPARE
jgi:zinc protease